MEKILFISLGLLIFIGIILFLYNKYQINNLETMSSNEMIKFITKNNDNTKISIAIIKDNKINYQTYGKNINKNVLYDYEIGSISKTFVGFSTIFKL